MSSDLTTVLQNAQSQDFAIRSQAEQYLNQAAATSYGPFLHALVLEFANEAKPQQIRQLAGLFMKNNITALDSEIKRNKSKAWLECDPALKENIKAGFLQSLMSPDPTISHTAAQVVAAYGAEEIPNKTWPQLLPTLLQHINQSSELTKKSCLEALGFICEELAADDLQEEEVNQILATIVSGMAPTNPEILRRASVKAMSSSLYFAEANFKRDNERDAIMQSILQCTQSSDEETRRTAFECMSGIGNQYYDEKLATHLTAIFQYSVNAIQNDTETVAMLALDFWMTLADIELGMLDDPERNQQCQRYVEKAMDHLLPVVLQTLTKQPQDVDSDDTSYVSNIGTECLALLAEIGKDSIVDKVIPFVEANIASPDWKFKDAAINAFAAILDGPSLEKMTPIVVAALPSVMACATSEHVLVRESVQYTLQCVCLFQKNALNDQLIMQMVQVMVLGMDDPESTVSSKACSAVERLAAMFDEPTIAPMFSNNFVAPFLTKLFAVSIREDVDENGLLVAAMEASAMVIKVSTVEALPTIREVLVAVLDRLEKSFALQMEPNAKGGLQGLLCVLVEECMKKLDDESTAAISDRIMLVVLQIFGSNNAMAFEDAMRLTGVIAERLADKFLRYLEALIGFLIKGLQNHEEYTVCKETIGALDYIIQALDRKIESNIYDMIVQELLNLLQSVSIDKTVKPGAIDLFSTIAMAVEGGFERYADIVLLVLGQAGQVGFEDDADEESIEHTNSLREAIMKAYTGIIMGLYAGSKLTLITPDRLGNIQELMRQCADDDKSSEEVRRTLLGLIGDTGKFFGSRMSDLFQHRNIISLVNDYLVVNDDPSIIATATYAHQALLQRS